MKFRKTPVKGIKNLPCYAVSLHFIDQASFPGFIHNVQALVLNSDYK
jgi:hypothetical protein